MSHTACRPKALYKHLLRVCEKLPKDSIGFYKASVKREFDTHRDEVDEERIVQIMDRAIKDADWIVEKYCKK